MSAALAGSLKPAKVIRVPGTIFAGFVTHAFNLSFVQVIFACVSAAEYEKPATDAALRPATPNRFGPMADRGEFFNSTDVIMKPGPANRFIRGGEIGERWYLWYEHGGIAYYRNIVLFSSDPSGTPHIIGEEQGLWIDNLCALTDALLRRSH